MPEGTSIEVADLFYNLPARRKFLKSDAAEAAQVSRIVTQLALCYPEIGFTLDQLRPEGAAVSAGGGAARSAVSAVRRARRSDRGAPRRRRRQGARLRRGAGRAGADARAAERLRQPPHRQGPDDRARDHRRLQRRVDQGAQSRRCICSSRCRTTRVDVNVHPTKAEVRFRDQSYIHEVIRRTLGDALGRGPAPELRAAGAALPALRSRRRCRCRPATARRFPSRWTTTGGAAALHRRRRFAPTSGQSTSHRPCDSRLAADRATAPSRTVHPPDDAARPVPRHLHHRRRRGGHRDHRPARRARARAVRADHRAADDRPAREPAAARADAGRAAARRPAGAARRTPRISSASDSRSRSSAATRIRVSAFPALLRREDCEAALRALAEDLEGLDRGSGVEDAIKRIAATMACHAAVKANYPLTAEKMAHILDELRRTVVFDDLPARPAGHAAADPARGREEFPADLDRRRSGEPRTAAFDRSAFARYF